MVHYPFRCSVAGVSFRQLDVVEVAVGDPVRIVAEPDNPHDAHAKRVEAAGRFIGYVPKAVAERLGATDHSWSGSVVERYAANGVLGVEIEVTGAVAEPEPAGDNNDASTRRTGAQPSAPAGRVVLVKRSGRPLGTLVGVDRDQRRVLVGTDSGVIAYPDGLVDILD